jgi:hypothetical protein
MTGRYTRDQNVPKTKMEGLKLVEITKLRKKDLRAQNLR